ncbi:MAG: ABC transporter permease [Armatimonadetes bacterium]|nr:ABC transporter permease [Armatimonadota bacterium]
MLIYAIRRLILAVPVFVGITLITFVLMYLVPGDATLIFVDPQLATIQPEVVKAIRKKWGLDDPLYVQYGRFLWNVARGDLGFSYRTNQDVRKAVLERLPATAKLALAAVAISTTIGVGTGVFSAVHRGSFVDTAGMVVALFGISMPVFWLGLMLMWFVGVKFPVLPPSGYGQGELNYLVLPSVTLGLALTASIARMTRSAMLDVISMDYVRTARAKGVNEPDVISRHALRNALIPVVTIIGVQMGNLMAGAVITETVFSWPGIGQLIVDAISQRDLPVVLGCVVFFALIFILVNLLVDLTYGVLDPRIRYG